MAGYTKEFLIEVALSRFQLLEADKIDGLRVMFNNFYDEVGKDKFRKYASVSADQIKKYKKEW